MQSKHFLAATALALFLVGCQTVSRDLTGSTPGVNGNMGDESFTRPLAGLSEANLAAFKRGREIFDKNFTPSDGLGPLYNNTSCKACHGFPNSGGGSAEILTIIAGETADGAPRTLKEKGGPVISDKAVLNVPLESLPMETKYISKRISPVTYGTGLIEAIPAADITLQLAPSARKQELGISGRTNLDGDKLGRLGYKLQTADMRSFTVTAANFEMGLSSPERPYEFFPNILPQAIAAPPLYATDSAKLSFVKSFFDARGAASASVDLTKANVDDLTAFQRYQAPPPPLAFTEQAKQGEEVFKKIGCAECHTPAFKTGPNAIGIPEGMKVAAYSDGLLHDMGAGLADGIIWQGTAKGSEWRTTPLWGLRYRRWLMHDGRTDNLEEAIQLHAGEGQKVTDGYNALAQVSKDALKAFLLSI